MRIFILFLILFANQGELKAQTFKENFDAATVGDPGTLPTGWVNVSGENSGDVCSSPVQCHEWTVHTGTTVSTVTGPSGDHTSGSGNYLFVEDSGNTNASVELLSPVLDLSTLNDPKVEFWMHSLWSTNNNDNDLVIDLMDASGTTILQLSLIHI